MPETAFDAVGCDVEPIHIPGAILPHGAMLVLDDETLDILQAADSRHKRERSALRAFVRSDTGPAA